MILFLSHKLFAPAEEMSVSAPTGAYPERKRGQAVSAVSFSARRAVVFVLGPGGLLCSAREGRLFQAVRPWS